MVMKKTLVFGILALFFLSTNAQVIILKSNQPDVLAIDAGSDTLICLTHSTILGGEFTAQGGSGAYFYSWYPNLYLDDHTSANPVCTPEETTTYLLTVTDASGCTSTGYVTVAVDLCLGINDFAQNSSVLIYPNPVSDRMTISGLSNPGKSVRITLLNQIGQTVFEDNFTSNLNSEITLDKLPDLQPGVYYIKLSSGDFSIVKTIHFL
jgi:hypothetical protein